MRVHVLVFGVLKDMIPAPSTTVDLPAGARARDLIGRYRECLPNQGKLLDSLAVAVNREYVSADHELRDGDEVALLPPVSGGSAERIELVREPIDARRVISEIKRGEDGAVAVFDGIVRDNTRGRRTLYLDYEAYEEMALAQMQSLAGKAIADFAVRDVAIVHRLGRLEVGETSVLIVVASAHRAAAFDACRWLIDTLKKTVPIWKKEHFEDGAVWADGEPFPPGISA
ncbi:MAG TPA: molybdenum cofactor biosynthesis protein MoaE [Acidobacteriaceae bacterium]|nr:molybdenum cofactor biosynthesis protein MoaE [Acidobacteriaceae bacterium]